MKQIESLIITIRGKQVILDRDLARLYGVDTKVLNQAVKRNVERFPEHFRYQLTENEAIELVTNCDRLQNLKHSSVLPYVFTEQGVAMLSTVLRSETAVNVSIRIMDAFVAMRRLKQSNSTVRTIGGYVLTIPFIWLAKASKISARNGSASAKWTGPPTNY